MVEMTFGIAAYHADNGQSGDPNVPQLLRRRVSGIGQAALRSAWALPQLDRARFVFASRHGEFERTIAMLTQLAKQEEPSPADFSLGVHNALAGLLSVAVHNHAGHTALAAGIDSFGFGLLEAAACLDEAPHDPVMLVYYDAPLPADYPDPTPAPTTEPLALALVLAPAADATRRVTMTATPIAPGADATPHDAAAAFLHFLRTDAPAASATGETMSWTWRHG